MVVLLLSHVACFKETKNGTCGFENRVGQKYTGSVLSPIPKSISSSSHFSLASSPNHFISYTHSIDRMKGWVEGVSWDGGMESGTESSVLSHTAWNR